MKIATSQTLQHLCSCKCYASQLTLRTNNCVISVSNTDYWKQTSTLQSDLSSEYNGHQLLNLNKYSQTSCKQSPTMQRFSGNLRESNHMGSLPRRGPQMSTLWRKIHCMQFISVLPRRSSMLSLKDQIICKAVIARKRLTIIGKIIIKHRYPKKSGCRRLQEVQTTGF